MRKRFYFDTFIEFIPDNRIIQLFDHLGWAGIGFPATNFSFSSHTTLITKNIKNTYPILYFKEYDERILSKMSLQQKTNFIIYVKTDNLTNKLISAKELRAIIIDVRNIRIVTDEIANLLKQHEDKFLILTFSSLINMHQRHLLSVSRNIRRHMKILNKISKQLIFASGAKNIYEIRSPRVFKDMLISIGLKESIILNALSDNPQRLFRMPNPIIVLEE